MNKKDLNLLYDDGSAVFYTDGKKFYALEYHYVDKDIFREYAGVEPSYSYLDEDGDVCHEYDDDAWDLEFEHIDEYVQEYWKKGYRILESGDDLNGNNEDMLFEVKEGDNGWHETLLEKIRKSEVI
jgi:hypothetical protein